MHDVVFSSLHDVVKSNIFTVFYHAMRLKLRAMTEKELKAITFDKEHFKIKKIMTERVCYLATTISCI